MKDPTYQEMLKAIQKSISDVTPEQPTQIEAAMVGVLATFMLEYVKLHQRVCYLEALQKDA